MLEVYAVKLDTRIDEHRLKHLMTYLDTEKQNRVMRYRKWQDAYGTLFGDLLVRYILRMKYNLSNDLISFSFNEFGKPYIKGFKDIHFNISHSGEWVVASIGYNDVGIDIEKIHDYNLAVAKRFFTPAEYRRLLSADERHAANYFFTMWTMKESYIKALGKGLSIPLNSFEVNENSENYYIDNAENGKRYFFRQYLLDMGYKLLACYASDEFCEKVVILNVNDIEETLLG